MFAAVVHVVHTATVPLLFAVAWPETRICLAVVVMAGVTSTSTDAEVHGLVEHTASVGIKQVIVDPCTAPQLPVPLATLAVGVGASPAVGTLVAVKTTWDAVSGPMLPMSKVNAT